MVLGLFVPITQARTTPQDIVDAKQAAYDAKAKNYSPQTQSKLKDLAAEVADMNRVQTETLEQIMVRQGEILNEYVFRKGLADKAATDGINRDLSDPIENARYWLTFAHEAVAYQAAKVYIFNLSSENNAKGDVNSTINTLQSDMTGLKAKVIKSHNIIEQLISK